LAMAAPDAEQRAVLGQYVLAAQLSDPAYHAIPADESDQRSPKKPQVAGGSGADFDSLIDLITTTVSPETWEEVGGEGSINPFETGVRVDPRGQLARVSELDREGRLQTTASEAQRAGLNADVSISSPMRIVSLPRLERTVSQQMDNDSKLEEPLLRLAGLTAVKHIFLFPDEGEVLLAGPAEGWDIDEKGRAIGRDSGKPTLTLDNLVTMLRVFSPSGEGIFGCSINPREENLKRVKQFVESTQAAGPLQPGTRGRWLRELRDRLGLQDVVVYGVPQNTHASSIIFEADYQMKLIGIGKLDGGPNIPDIFKLYRRARLTSGVPLTALRWWLTMKYDGIMHSPDHDAYELLGSSVLVQSENQFVTAQGKHVGTGKAEPVNREFAENFTNHYQELANREKVFAELHGLFDLAMAAAICHSDGLLERSGWSLGCFAPGGGFQVAEVETPVEIESVMNHRVFGGRDIVVQVAGGVVGNVRALVQNKQLRGLNADLTKTRARTSLPQERWWWDAAP